VDDFQQLEAPLWAVEIDCLCCTSGPWRTPFAEASSEVSRSLKLPFLSRFAFLLVGSLESAPLARSFLHLQYHTVHGRLKEPCVQGRRNQRCSSVSSSS
jgi:hypothetical protein